MLLFLLSVNLVFFHILHYGHPIRSFHEEIAMLAIAALAVLLAGEVPASPSPATSPAPTPPRTPFSLDASAGWVITNQVDPFGRTGPTTFSVGMPLIGARIRNTSWYAELAGQLMHTSLANRNVTASVGRDLFRTGSLRWGLGMEVSDVRFRREDFRTDDVLVGTNRAATAVLAGLNIGTGTYRGMSVRVSALGGWYQNRYGSIVELPGFAGVEPLADSEERLVGGKLTVNGITIANRIEFSGSVRYLRIAGSHPSSIPGDELSGSANLTIRLFRLRGKQLFIGGLARFGPAGPALITDKTFGLRGIWRLR
jgi:hypothetical protein